MPGAFGLVVSLFYFVAVLFLSEVLRDRLNLSPLLTRRLTILGVTHSVLVLPQLFQEWQWFAIAPAIFAVIYLIGGAGRGFSRRRKSVFGAVYIFISIIGLFYLFWPTQRQPFAIAGILVLGWGDTLAALMGRYLGWHKYYIYDEEKSWEGTLGMFVGSWATLAPVTSVMLGISGGELVAYVTLTAAFAAILEAISIRGTDNFVVPVGTACLLFYLVQTNIPSAQISLLVTGAVGSFILSLAAYWLGALDEGGVAGSILVGTFIYTFGGWHWVPGVLVFFVSASILTRWSHRYISAEVENKGQLRRGVDQVVANGGVAITLAVLSFLNVSEPYLLFLGFLGAMAGVTADTWSTEIGLARGGRPHLIFSGKLVPPGTSGGVTRAGLLGATAGSLALAVTGLVLSMIGGLSWTVTAVTFVAVFVAGLAGAVMDSIIGAKLQVQYYCEYCLKVTEKSMHGCGCQTKAVRGLRWLDNNGVNFLTSVWSALVSMGIYSLFYFN